VLPHPGAIPQLNLCGEQLLHGLSADTGPPDGLDHIRRAIEARQNILISLLPSQRRQKGKSKLCGCVITEAT